MAVIIILMGLAFPVFTSVQNAAKKTQAKNDLVQIVTAVNAFYTEYGKYPISGTADIIIGPGGTGPTSTLFTTLRALDSTTNPRQIAFITPPDVKDGDKPRSGIATKTVTVNGILITIGELVDPWGTPYVIAIDGDYSGFVRVGTALKYTDLTYTKDPPTSGPDALQAGVIGASYGNDQTKAKKTPASGNFKNSDDVISWQ